MQLSAHVKLPKRDYQLAIIGAGPAGLMAAEVLSRHVRGLHVFESMPTVGRKFLLAGRGGLNLTHAEAMPTFMSRYGNASNWLYSALSSFDNEDVRSWSEGLGRGTFVGSSNRVFPVGMKASPLLRAWLNRLQSPSGNPAVSFHVRHRWIGWNNDEWVFQTPEGLKSIAFDAVVLAVGGGSWPRMGSDGAWVPLLRSRGVEVSSLVASNCGFDMKSPWTDHFQRRFAGKPFKSVVLTVLPASIETKQEAIFQRKGEFVATSTGVEGSLIYAASAILRDQIAQFGSARISLDLLPEFSRDHVFSEVTKSRGSRSLSNHLKSRLGLSGIKLGLMYEVLSPETLKEPSLLAAGIKGLPLLLGAARPLNEAISSAGGVALDAVDNQGMLNALPGVFCAGEMLDWEAPTGGYLLTACLALGRKAGEDVLQYLASKECRLERQNQFII